MSTLSIDFCLEEFDESLMTEEKLLTRQGGAALWRQIADKLDREIRDGILETGAQLPAEGRLAERFGVNRHTVRQAVRHMVQEGLLRLERGRGTFVQSRNVEYPIGSRTRFSEILLDQGISPSHEILGGEMIKAGKKEAQILGIRTGANMVRVTTSGHANGLPITYSHHLFPDSLCPGILAAIDETKSITAALKSFGFGDYERKWTRISTELPNEEMASYLKIPTSRPVLKTVSLDITSSGQPLDLGTAWFVGDLCRLVVGENIEE